MSYLDGSSGPSNRLGGECPVGLAQNAPTVLFQCGTCEYYLDGICHNEDPRLNNRKVEPAWCCNLYDHEGMQVII